MKKIYIVFITTFLLLFSANQMSGKGIREKIADSYYKNLAYQKAIPYYIELAKSKKVTAEILRKTADSYNKIGDTKNALLWYKELYKKSWASTSDKYEYFLLLRKAGNYEASLKVMESYLTGGGTATKFIKYLKENPNYIADVKKQNSNKYKIRTLSFNSSDHDFGAAYYEDGILFTSPEKRGRLFRRPKKFAWDSTNFLQLYYVKNTSEGSSEPEAFSLSKKDKYHDGPITFNTDFSEAYLTRSNYSPKGRLSKSKNGTIEINLYTSTRNEDGTWSELQPFTHNSSEYSIGCATLSKEGDIMVFASDMPGGEGETDLWLCKRDADGNWGTPAHLGDKINSSRRDNYPWLDKDGNLYFASDGGIYGLGGYDIFWVPGFLQGRDKVYNVGAPINSEADDFGFIYNSDNATGFFNSGRKGVVGNKGYDDIFAFDKLVSLLEVQVLDKETKEPIPFAKGCLLSEFSDSIEEEINLDDEGRYSRELGSKTYIACANAEGYNPGEVKVYVPKGKFVTALIELDKEEIVETVYCPEITLEDIFYDFDKYAIRNDASAALDELLVFLEENPGFSVKLKAHTDARGTHKYNQWLSQKRADSALEYLANRGIDRSRMVAIGFGETQPVNHCTDGIKCSEQEHQANRRTIVEIITDDSCVEVNYESNPYTDSYNEHE